jgi:hypothetical protein
MPTKLEDADEAGAVPALGGERALEHVRGRLGYHVRGLSSQRGGPGGKLLV